LSPESFKRLPLGCDPDHPFADDLMRKDFAAGMRFSEQDVCGADFLNQVTKATKAAAPFLEFLTRAVGLPWAPGDRPARREILTVE
jgi:uncharacterized protein (DUF2461 family)